MQIAFQLPEKIKRKKKGFWLTNVKRSKSLSDDWLCTTNRVNGNQYTTQNFLSSLLQLPKTSTHVSDVYTEQLFSDLFNFMKLLLSCQGSLAQRVQVFSYCRIRYWISSSTTPLIHSLSSPSHAVWNQFASHFGNWSLLGPTASARVPSWGCAELSCTTPRPCSTLGGSGFKLQPFRRATGTKHPDISKPPSRDSSNLPPPTANEALPLTCVVHHQVGRQRRSLRWF